MSSRSESASEMVQPGMTSFSVVAIVGQLPRELQKRRLHKTGIAPSPNDYMIVDRYVEQATGGNELFGDIPVVGRRRWVTTRVVVHQNDGRRLLGDGFPEHFPRMHER